MNELQGKEVVYKKADPEKGTSEETRAIIVKIAINTKNESDDEKAPEDEGEAPAATAA